MSWLAVATGLQFLILIGLAVVVLSLARQIGILHERTAPASLARNQPHLHAGDRLPEITVPTLAGGKVSLGGGQTTESFTSLLFIAADCPICRSVLPAYQSALETGAVSAYWVGDGMPLAAFERYADEQGIDPERLLLSQELGLRLGVRALPALALLDAGQRLVSLDIIDGPAQIRKLMATESFN
ncbi:MAG: hypothetical protein R3E82_07850 [Pseudomonadales bacterium]|nr:hypothetical protein [Pseudomonadales bacterium]